MPTCRRFAPQNWLIWQRLLIKFTNLLAVGIFFIDDINATVRVAIRAPVVE